MTFFDLLKEKEKGSLVFGSSLALETPQHRSSVNVLPTYTPGCSLFVMIPPTSHTDTYIPYTLSHYYTTLATLQRRYFGHING